MSPSARRVLRALILASLAALVFPTHVFVRFSPLRVKVVQSPVPAAGGAVRVSTAGSPRTNELGPPFALIARVRMPAGGPGRLAITVDGRPVCERDVADGSTRRLDCAVTLDWNRSTDHEVAIHGPTTSWTLESLELATHHGNTSGVQALFVLPGESTGYVRPARAWTIVLWLVVSGVLLFLDPHPMTRRIRVVYRTVAGAVIVLMALSQCSERVSNYRVVLAARTFLIWLAMLLAPRLWAGGRWLAECAGRLGHRVQASAAPRMAAFFEEHPAWRPKPQWTRTAWQWTAPAIVIGFFCAPLFVNLREPDMRSDEAIYSYAVERILDTGDWLTPRSIPNDDAFLEKPPLKFWLVAAGMRAGLLPTDEQGMRWLDALFGAVAFLYVYALGRGLSGPLCGVVAVLVLFTLDPLVFAHGLRGNNMEAALLLCYCGGVFHFAKWVEAGPQRARGHAAAVCAWFFLGFMTKFVAALFLPAVCVTALALGPGGRARVRSRWRDWTLPVLLTAALSVPWFIYQSVREPAHFWQIILGAHVYQRFTSSLDSAHLHPWPFYFVQTWKELRIAGTNGVVMVGIAALLVAAIRQKPWLARLLLIWGVLPVVAISLGTSKLVHYAYPFWPALGLAAGLFIAEVVRAIDGPPGAAVAGWLTRLVPGPVVAWRTKNVGRRRVLVVLIVAAVVTAAWTAVRGPFAINVGGATYFRNSTVLAPLLVACGLLMAGGYTRIMVRLAVTAGLIAIVPTRVYSGELAHVMRTDHPIRAVRDCMVSVQRTGVKTGSGVLGVYRDIQHYGYYYYLWRVGAWTFNPEFSLEQTERRLWTPGEQTPVIVSRQDYETLVRQADSTPMPAGVRVEENLAILLPGPFQACLPDVLAAGGQPLWKAAATDPRR
jgi:4-amino-4-deoxy-L-arabinose transferase-like glycosyltransferase